MMFNIRDNQLVAKSSDGILSGEMIRETMHRMQKVVPARSLVFLLSTNTLGSLAGYISFIESRIVPVMLDATMDNMLLKELITIYTPQYLWIPKSQKEEGLWKDWDEVCEAFNYILVKNPDAPKEIAMYEELALLLTTSGSTGSPKLVRISYKNIDSNARSIAQYLEITDRELPITTLPMHYSYGMSIINSHLIKGATLLLSPHSIMEKEFWTFFKEQGATSLAGVPYTYQMLKRLRLQRMDLPSLKTLTQAGGKLSEELVREFATWAQETGRKFFVMYGQTEATARMSYLPWEKCLEKSASIGIAIPGGKFSLIDTNDNKITEPGTAGELIYQGDNVTLGYAEHVSELSRGDENHGLLRTGDVAYFDEEGFYYIVGRLKRFVKVFGNRINLDQTEQIAKQAATDCACTGVDDKIIIHITDPALENDMKNYISNKLGLHLSAIAINVVTEIPKNSSGKVQYTKL